jgi:Alpha/beta hydrolase family
VVQLVLLPSPLTRAAAWGWLPAALEARGTAVAVVEPEGDDDPPYALRWVASCALQIGALDPGPVVLVGHSGAGLLLAQLGFALRAAHRPVAAYAFVDAGIPRQLPGSRLDVYASEDESGAGLLRNLLDADATFPHWTTEDLADEAPDPTDRQTLVDALRPRGRGYWIEPLPLPTDWPDAPCVYLRTSAAYDIPLRTAGARGWPTASLQLGHFPGFVDPHAAAFALVTLLEAVVPEL